MKSGPHTMAAMELKINASSVKKLNISGENKTQNASMEKILKDKYLKNIAYVRELIMNAILILLWIKVDSVSLLLQRKTLRPKVKLLIVKMKGFIMSAKGIGKFLEISVLLAIN